MSTHRIDISGDDQNKNISGDHPESVPDHPDRLTDHQQK